MARDKDMRHPKRAFIQFFESSNIEAAQKSFIQSCNEIGMDPHGTIDTFYVGFKEEFKVLKTFLKRIPCDHARIIGRPEYTIH